MERYSLIIDYITTKILCSYVNATNISPYSNVLPFDSKYL